MRFFFTHKFSLWNFLRWLCLLIFFPLRFWWGICFTHIFFFGLFWGELVCWNVSPLDFGEVFFLLIYFLFAFFRGELICRNISPLDFGEVFFFTHIFSLWIFQRWVNLPKYFSLRFWWGFFLLIYFFFGLFWGELVCWNVSPLDFGEIIFFTHKFSLWNFQRWVYLPKYFSLRFWWGSFLLIYFFFGLFWGELVCWNVSPLDFGDNFFTHIFSLWVFLRWVSLLNFLPLDFREVFFCSYMFPLDFSEVS